MDISIVFAVGSFAISERVLRPKATILVILGCVLCYDLTTKTHDASSLRVYRGPALLAFTLLCCAYSLRTWRRNGVACDELIFLPGTAHERRSTEVASSPELGSTRAHASEGDAAAGPGLQLNRIERNRSRSEELAPMLEMRPLTDDHSAPPVCALNGVEESPEEFDRESRQKHDFDDEEENVGDDNSWDGSSSDGQESVDGSEGQCMICTSSLTNRGSANVADNAGDDHSPQTELRRFRENHPRITRIGTFFFFRSPTSSTSENAVYAPSGPSVFGAALDLSMPILFNFHLFIEAVNHMSSTGSSEATAKILPLIFLSVLIVRSFIPPKRRGRFWSTVKFTAMAPFHSVSFRDAYVGDVMTSLVRPVQDVLFALSYYVTVIWGTITQSYGLTKSGEILERSWFLHNVLLTSCALLPLWWKFLQTLRQSYDAQSRWPFLGDAFKYLSAAVVILYGMTHPEDRRTFWWIVSFIVCTLYQIWWDTVMDWELLVITPKTDTQPSSESPWCTISSLRPSSYILLTVQMYIIQPVEDALRRLSAAIPSYEQIQLRPRRLYKTKAFYWKIFIFNACFRFTWMLCFIPPFKLSSSGEERTFSSDVGSYFGVLLPVAEIIRRCCWGFLKLEMETIRIMDSDVAYTSIESNESEENDSEKRRGGFRQCLPTWLDTQQKQQHTAATSSSTPRITQLLTCSEAAVEKLFLAELSIWAIAFVGFGYWSAFK